MSDMPTKKNPFAELLQSKKFIVLVVGLLASISSKIGLNLPDDVLHDIVNLCMTYIVAQGAVDVGGALASSKKAAATPATPTPTTPTPGETP